MVRWKIFLHSVAFVLGFSTIFSILGILLQSALSSISSSVQQWLSYLGGVVIIFFGLFLLGLLKIPFLEREHKITIRKRFSFAYLTSFVFGAAFAVGWTPCVGAVLGAILTLAISHPGNAFGLLFAYASGLGFPFLIVGACTDAAGNWISKIGPKIKYFNILFGIVLILLGILVFTQQLSRIANFPLLVNLFSGASVKFQNISFLIAFLGGFASFLSPCVLPLIPAFLSYLAVTTVQEPPEK